MRTQPRLWVLFVFNLALGCTKPGEGSRVGDSGGPVSGDPVVGDFVSDDGGDSNGDPSSFALRLDAGLLAGASNYGGYEFVPLIDHVVNGAEDRGSCSSTNNYCDAGVIPVDNTDHDALYLGQIWSCGEALVLAIPVPNGTYHVYLHNMENVPAAFVEGGRVFSVEAEGATAIAAWDIFMDAGALMGSVEGLGNTADRKMIEVTVADGVLDVRLVQNARCPKICAVEILAPSLMPLPLTSDSTACGSHHHLGCDNDDVYWFNSCGVREERQKDCGTDEHCRAGVCEPNSGDPFVILQQWDFETSPLGEYTISNIEADFPNLDTAFPHGGQSQIETDPIQGRVIKSISPAVEEDDYGGNGFGMHSYLDASHTAYQELYMSYRVKFSGTITTDNLEGKLPGLRGLPSAQGGDHPGEGFYYASMHQDQKILAYHYDRTGTYWPWGTNATRGKFLPDTWYTVTQRVVINSFTGGSMNPDGINEIWVDGVNVIQEDFLKVLQDEDKGIDAFTIAGYHNGSARPHEAYVWVDDVTIWYPNDDSTWGMRILHDPEQTLPTPLD